jgi:DNA-binding protein YbaB
MHPSAGDGPEHMLSTLHGLRARIAEAKEELATRRASETSRNRLVTATIGPDGALVELKLNSTAYRSMAPAELAAVIRETIERARGRMRTELLETVQPLLPGAVRARDVAEGRLSVEDFLEAARRGRDGSPQ